MDPERPANHLFRPAGGIGRSPCTISTSESDEQNDARRGAGSRTCRPASPSRSNKRPGRKLPRCAARGAASRASASRAPHRALPRPWRLERPRSKRREKAIGGFGQGERPPMPSPPEPVLTRPVPRSSSLAEEARPGASGPKPAPARAYSGAWPENRVRVDPTISGWVLAGEGAAARSCEERLRRNETRSETAFGGYTAMVTRSFIRHERPWS